MSELPYAYRPVDSLASDEVDQYLTVFRQAANRNNFSNGEKKSLAVPGFAGRVMLLGTGQLRHFLEYHGISPEDADGEELADHLGDTLPDRLDETLIRPMLPSETFQASARRRELIIGVCPELVEEQEIIRAAVASFYEVEATPDSWPKKGVQGGHSLVYTSHAWSADVIDLAKVTFDGQFASQARDVTYHPMVMDMVPFDF